MLNHKHGKKKIKQLLIKKKKKPLVIISTLRKFVKNVHIFCVVVKMQHDKTETLLLIIQLFVVAALDCICMILCINSERKVHAHWLERTDKK